MPQLPESVRPYAAALAKYHFWILALLAPLLLVPLLWVGTSALDAQIRTRRAKIDGHLSALRNVKGIAEHPNEQWKAEITEQAARIRAETLAEWQRFHDGQAAIRVWPEKLGKDFIREVTALKPGGTLGRPALQRYMNVADDLARELPVRMGAGSEMTEGSGAAKGGGESAARPSASTRPLVWSAADQQRLLASFQWTETPSTVQVLLAQEELWAYGLFCDAIKRANKGATAAFDAPITEVGEMLVGHPAAEDKPGGQGTARIALPKVQAVPGADLLLDAQADQAANSSQPAVRPLHPRFAGRAQGTTSSADAAAAGLNASPDDEYRGWIYTDFNGRPLTAAELRTLPEARMVHLMPFKLVLTMDERRLDALLADLASNQVPIDVRQVRINAGENVAAASGAAGSSAERRGLRPYDIRVELRGTIGFAALPDAAALGGSEPATGGIGG